MDFTFKCPHCSQELEVDISAVGSDVECPACNRRMAVPTPEPSQIHVAPHGGAPASDDPNRPADKHFLVPQHEGPSETLIVKPPPTDVVAPTEKERKIRVRTFRRIDTMTVNKDHFDEVVTDFLQKIGQEFIISIQPVTYTYRELATGHYVADYGVMIIFRG